MDIDVLERKVRDLIVANQNMGAQIADLQSRMAALEEKSIAPASDDEQAATVSPLGNENSQD